MNEKVKKDFQMQTWKLFWFWFTGFISGIVITLVIVQGG